MQQQRPTYLSITKRYYELPKVYWKILHAAPALDGTLVFMGMRAFREDILTHISADGQTVLKQIVFDQNTDSFGMLINQCCVLETRKDRMVVLNLDTDEHFYLDHYFQTEEVDQSFIDVFAESQSVVIRENGRYGNTTFKLTYYHYPLTEDSQPYHVFFNNADAWTYQYRVIKANNHSMYCWFKGRHDDYFEFKTYDLREDPNRKFTIHKYPQNVGKKDGMQKTEVAVTTMWEMRPGVFMLVCISSRKDKANNNYVLNTHTDQIREAKFTFEQYQPLTIDQMSFGKMCMFRTFDFQNGKALQTPIYYISNETEEIVCTDVWYCSHLNKYTTVGYDSNMLIDNQYENGDVKEITVKSIKVIQEGAEEKVQGKE